MGKNNNASVLRARDPQFWQNENPQIRVEWMSTGFQFSNVNLVFLNLWNLDILEIRGIYEGCHWKRGEKKSGKSMELTTT